MKGTSSNTKGAKENKDYLSKIKKENQGNKEKGTVSIIFKDLKTYEH